MGKTKVEATPAVLPPPTAYQPQTMAGTSKKRKAPSGAFKVPFGNRGELDLAGPLPVTYEVVEALRNRIIELENQLGAREAQDVVPAVQATQGRPTKKAKTTTNLDVTMAEASTSASGPPAGGSTQAIQDPKKRKMQIKKVVDQLKRECKAADFKFQGEPKTVKFDEIIDYGDFQELFRGQGELIQPTPTNNPKSVVTIIRFNASQIISFLGPDCTKGLKGNLWTRGGAPTFAKSIKIGQCDLCINFLEVSYSKNSMKCTYKFEVEDVDGEESRGGVRGPTPRNYKVIVPAWW